MDNHHNAIIIGGGVAGLTAALPPRRTRTQTAHPRSGRTRGRALSGKDENYYQWVENFPMNTACTASGLVCEISSIRSNGTTSCRDSFPPGRARIYRTATLSAARPRFDHPSQQTSRAAALHPAVFCCRNFSFMLDPRDWAGIFSVWSTLLMAIGIDPFVEDQPLEGLTFGKSPSSVGGPPCARSSSSHAQTDFHRSRSVPLAGFLAFPPFLYTVTCGAMPGRSSIFRTAAASHRGTISEDKRIGRRRQVQVPA